MSRGTVACDSCAIGWKLSRGAVTRTSSGILGQLSRGAVARDGCTIGGELSRRAVASYSRGILGGLAGGAIACRVRGVVGQLCSRSIGRGRSALDAAAALVGGILDICGIAISLSLSKTLDDAFVLCLLMADSGKVAWNRDHWSSSRCAEDWFDGDCRENDWTGQEGQCGQLHDWRRRRDER